MQNHKFNFLAFITCLLQQIRDLILVIVGFAIVAATCIFQELHGLLKYLARQKLVVFVVLLLLIFGVFSLIVILTSTHNFEANLICWIKLR